MGPEMRAPIAQLSAIPVKAEIGTDDFVSFFKLSKNYWRGASPIITNSVHMYISLLDGGSVFFSALAAFLTDHSIIVILMAWSAVLKNLILMRR